MPVSEAKKKANKKWNDNNIKQWNVSIPIKEAEQVDSYCAVRGIKRTSFIRDALKEKMMREPLPDGERIE